MLREYFSQYGKVSRSVIFYVSGVGVVANPMWTLLSVCASAGQGDGVLKGFWCYQSGQLECSQYYLGEGLALDWTLVSESSLSELQS